MAAPQVTLQSITGVDVELRIAGVGSRSFAFVIDWHIRAILAFASRSAAEPWLKLLESAVANAEHNHELVGEDLKIFSVHADEGPTLKRYRPRAMGRATRIRKRTSHLTITLTPKES